MDFRFTADETLKRADEVVDYLRGPRLWIPQLDYPDYDDWLQRVHSELKRETKRVLLCLCSGSVVGAVVYQRHKQAPSLLEVKNITVRPDMQGRHIASFLLRNAEVDGSADFSSKRIVIDAKSGNTGIRSFLMRNGYRPSGTSDLYGLGSGTDVTYSKPSGRRD